MKNTFQMVKGQLWIHFQGRTFIYEGSKKQFGKKSKQKDSAGELFSPMPGKITKVLKNQGDQVQQGEVVLVMEAMKMEYTLKSDVAGLIEQMNCQVGDQVALGKLLVKIKVEVKVEAKVEVKVEVKP